MHAANLGPDQGEGLRGFWYLRHDKFGGTVAIIGRGGKQFFPNVSVVTETLFSIPGMGQLLTQAVLNRDYPMVQGGLFLVTAFLVLINIGVDVCYSLLDPRVRHE